jgi:hypothetical protein
MTYTTAETLWRKDSTERFAVAFAMDVLLVTTLWGGFFFILLVDRRLTWNHLLDLKTTKAEFFGSALLCLLAVLCFTQLEHLENLRATALIPVVYLLFMCSLAVLAQTTAGVRAGRASSDTSLRDTILADTLTGHEHKHEDEQAGRAGARAATVLCRAGARAASVL